MKSTRKLMALVLTVCIVLASFSFTTIQSKADGTKVIIKASEVKTKKSDAYEYNSQTNTLYILCKYDEVYFEIDQDLVLDRLIQNPDNRDVLIAIEGDKKLTINKEINVVCKYIQESGTNVEIIDGIFINGSDTTIEPGATFTINDTGITHNGWPALFSQGSFISSGNININTVSYGIAVEENVNISGGEIHVNSLTEALRAGKILDISGGNLYLYSSESLALFSYTSDINISGGYIECEIGAQNDNDTYKMNIGALSDINVRSPLYVIAPSNSSIKTYQRRKKTYNYIADANGDFPKKIVIGNKAAEEAYKKAEEEAAKKAAEEAAKKAAEEAAAKKAAEEAAKKNAPKYSNEWVNGKWYNADGTQTYQGILEWKCNSTGWWVEDTTGWYPVSQWQKIDGKWYYFLDTGYMDYSEYRDGCWLGSDGAWVEEYYGGTWKSDGKGWWYEDAAGWYPQSQYLWIDGVNYYFGADGYWQ